MACETTSGNGLNTFYLVKRVTQALQPRTIDYSCSAVLYRYRAGIPWRDLPECFGDFRVVHTRHTRWSEKGVWKQVFDVLASDADNEYAAIDATILRAHQRACGCKKKHPQIRAKPKP